MKLSSFIHQTTITSMNTPIWNIMHINISITTIRTFIIPTIFNRQLFVIVSENLHRGYILQDFSGEVNSFFQEILRVLEAHPQPFHQLIVYNVRSLKEPIHCQTLPNITFKRECHNKCNEKCCHDVPLINSYLYSEY